MSTYNNNGEYYYTCSPYNTPQLLRTSGEQPLEISIPYIYELDTPITTTTTTTNDNTNSNNNEEVLTVAIQHVELTLLNHMATIANLVDCNDNTPFFRRKLRRGEHSLIAILIENGSTSVRSEEVCHSENTIGVSNYVHQKQEEEEEMEQFVEGVTGQFSGSVVVMEGEEELLQEQEQREEEDNIDASNVLAETRVDGVVDIDSVILRSGAPLQPSSSSRIDEMEEGEGDVAYNYWSTRSEVKEAEPIRTQPEVDVVFQQSSVVPPKPRTGANVSASVPTKCNVVQGKITLFIANNADPFENLDGRIRDAIKEDLNDELVLQQEFLNEDVVGLRLLVPASSMDDLPSFVSVTAPASPASSTSNTNDAVGSSTFASSNASIGVIGALAAIFLMLIGLFAYTSRPHKRSRHLLNDDSDDDVDLNSCQFDDNKYANELDAVSAIFSGKQSAATWWQEPVRVTDFKHSRSELESVGTVEAHYSTGGVVIGDDEEEVLKAAQEKSPSILPLSFFNRSKSKDEETDCTSNLVVDEFIRSDGNLDDEETVDMDAHLNSKPKKKPFIRRLFRKKRKADFNEDADDGIVIEEIQSRAETQDQDDQVLIEESFAHDGFETTRTAPLRPLSAYTSPTAVCSRVPSEYRAGNILQSCSSGALSSCLPEPEIGDDESNISALTDNYFGYSGRRKDGGEQLMRMAAGAVTQCVAPTDDTSVANRSNSVEKRQLALRQPHGNTLDPFADCWNPFEGNFWKGWFE